MLEMRTFENRPGQVYDPTDLTRLFAEDINALVEYVNTLLLIVNGVLDLGDTQVYTIGELNVGETTPAVL